MRSVFNFSYYQLYKCSLFSFLLSFNFCCCCVKWENDDFPLFPPIKWQMAKLPFKWHSKNGNYLLFICRWKIECSSSGAFIIWLVCAITVSFIAKLIIDVEEREKILILAIFPLRSFFSNASNSFRNIIHEMPFLAFRLTQKKQSRTISIDYFPLKNDTHRLSISSVHKRLIGILI